MKKIASFAAISVLASAPAFAQTSSLQIYGVLDAGIEVNNTGVPGNGNNVLLNTGNLAASRLGFRGTEDLGGGLKALFNLDYWKFERDGNEEPKAGTASVSLPAGANPIFRDAFTADPAPIVVGDTLYVHVGHDEARDGEMFTMHEWLCYSTKDMTNWQAHGPVMRATDFKWARGDAWASQVVEKNGKFYFYTTVTHDQTSPGRAIGVAVADSPLGPFKDARGTALVTDATTPSNKPWNDIDPTVFIDDDGTAYMAWGNPYPYFVKLKPNMIELDGEIQKLDLPNYTEGPWLHKRGNMYYLTYAAFAHQGTSEKICYATAPKITGPWTYRGILTGFAKNSFTIHPGIVEFKGQSYLFYHNATLTLNGQGGALGRRSVCVEYLQYNPDGTMQPVNQTVAGVSVPAAN